MCPYKTKADPDLFSEYMNSVKQPNYRPTEKLVCDQTNKKNYFIHYRLLKFYLKMGMKVTKIKCVYSFESKTCIYKRLY